MFESNAFKLLNEMCAKAHMRGVVNGYKTDCIRFMCHE